MNGRIFSHPILGALPALALVEFTFDGRTIAAVEGEPIAAALLANGIRTLRHTEREGHPRGIYCGIGHCYECRVVVDGQPGCRACITPVRAGMVVASEAKAP